jgi:Glucodextranase, domain B
MPGRRIRASAPPSNLIRRYRPIRTGPRVPGPVAIVVVAAICMLGLLTLTVGTGLAAGFIGGIGSAFNNAVSHLTSHAPATVPPSGVTLDTPSLDAPDAGGYTNQATVVLEGTVPGDTVGKSGYTVRVYLLGKNGDRAVVANVVVGGTTRFGTPALTLKEGNNSFVATLVSSGSEGQPSPTVTYILKTSPPKIVVSSPASGAKVSTSTLNVTGTVDAGATVTIRNEQALGGAVSSQVVGADGKFKLTVPVVAGPNTIDLSATDLAGNSASKSLIVNRDYGQLAAHLSVSPSRFAASSQTTIKITLRATSLNGGPLANAKATFTVSIEGLAPIVSPELTTDATGTATWQVTISGASIGNGNASVLLTSPAGDQVTATTAIVTT